MHGRCSLRLLIALIAFASILVSVTLSQEKAQPVTASPAMRIAPISDSDPTRLLPIPPPPPRFPVSQPGKFGFPQFARAAGMIFSGTVTHIDFHPPPARQGFATVAITFDVEHAIRGVQDGQDIIISQWMGLWSSGQSYRVGERVFLFLYPKSKLGLTSSVGGPMGRFQFDPSGRVLLTPQHRLAFRADPVLGGKSLVSLGDFALAVRRASGEE